MKQPPSRILLIEDNAADVYASAGLFRKLWPKLLNATATEALANLEKDKKFDAPPAKAVVTFMADAEKPKATSKKIADNAVLDTYDSQDALLLNVRAASQPDGRSVDLHSSFLKK